jgi:hypothetical protein
MQLEQKDLRIPQPPRGREVGPIASGPQAPQQSGLAASLQGHVQGEGPSPFQFLAESLAREQQGHGSSASADESDKNLPTWVVFVQQGGMGDALDLILVLHCCARPLAGPPVISTGLPVVAIL